jgi:hypothetical protein
MALMMVGSIVFFITSIQSRSAEIKRQNAELIRKKADLSDLEKLRARRTELRADIARYSNAATVYDSIAPGSDKWSRVLHYIANGVEDLNSLWIYRMARDEQTPGALMLNGRSIYRTRISRLASLFEEAVLKQVRTSTIRNKVVYEFDLSIKKIDKSDVVSPTKKR